MRRTSLIPMFVIVAMFIAAVPIQAQTQNPPGIDWVKTYPHHDTSIYPRSFIKMPDGGYIIAQQKFLGRQSIALQRVDSMGNTLWFKPVDGISPNNEYMGKVQLTSDGHLIVLEAVDSVQYQWVNYYFRKFDTTGSLHWTKVWRGRISVNCGTDGSIYTFGGLVGLPDNGWMAASDEKGYLRLARFDSSGSPRWTVFSSDSLNMAKDMIFTSIGPLIASIGDRLLQFDSSGQRKWDHNYPSRFGAGISAVCRVNDNALVMAGVIADWECPHALVFSVDSLGGVMWEDSSGYGDDRSEFYSVASTSDGGTIAVGYYEAVGGPRQGFVVKHNSRGDRSWIKIISDSIVSELCGCQEADGHQYVITGRASDTTSSPWNFFPVLIKLTPDISIAEQNQSQPWSSFSVCPTITRDRVAVKGIDGAVGSISVYSINGSSVERITAKDQRATWNCDGRASPGVYFISDGVNRAKIVVR